MSSSHKPNTMLSFDDIVNLTSQSPATNLPADLGVTIGLLNILHGLEVHPGVFIHHLPPVGQVEVNLVAPFYKDREEG